jgi:two-component system chemotaxis sensor kinase CheA
MGFDMDEDILQDFLVEAGEILELLSEQLVQLENNPTMQICSMLSLGDFIP